MLLCQYIFSRFLWPEPIAKKTQVRHAFEDILDKSQRKPSTPVLEERAGPGASEVLEGLAQKPLAKRPTSPALEARAPWRRRRRPRRAIFFSVLILTPCRPGAAGASYRPILRGRVGAVQ